MKPAVLIITYNSEKYIENCIDTLEKDGDIFSIWMIDNSSSDRTLELIRKRKKISLIPLEKNEGYGKAINAGLKEIFKSADVAVVMNPDITATPNNLMQLIKGVEEQSLDVAQPRILLPDGKINTLGSEMTWLGLSYVTGYEKDKNYEYKKKISAISGACFVLRKTAFEKTSGFDEALFLYAEDTEFSIRSEIIGLKIGRVDSAEVTHVYSYGVSKEKIEWLEYGRLWLVLTLFSTRTLVVLFPLLLVFELGLKIQYPKVSRIKIYRKIFKNMSKLKEKRKSIAKARVVSDREIFKSLSPTINFEPILSLPVKLFNIVALCYCKVVYAIYLI